MSKYVPTSVVDIGFEYVLHFKIKVGNFLINMAT